MSKIAYALPLAIMLLLLASSVTAEQRYSLFLPVAVSHRPVTVTIDQL